ncbi:MAG: tRNA (adenosine(37)-N6)-threonylcarbamoyltransferase complex ATPase subunit type 1 TsaE [Candidatus Peribacteria bacterium]|jgi:tRNA threonylcarbamoyladenosine biosynthesis protein TsaE|nr:tRNA (adenosine(37)-N6)-threonylcarbamoyltransferase complex ATPase subunit type 1 TsaE [Candidatus Peribacteria bacterium]
MYISSPEAMHQFGKALAHQHHSILLSGDLGAGKTTLAKGFAAGLGINPVQVQSPTYTYLNVYDQKLLHLDMYRLERFDQLVEKGILEQMDHYDYLLIERPKWIEMLEL